MVQGLDLRKNVSPYSYTVTVRILRYSYSLNIMVAWFPCQNFGLGMGEGLVFFSKKAFLGIFEVWH